MKKLIVMLLALMMLGIMFAQTTVTIGTGTSTGRYPLNDYFVNSRSQSLYTESEIGIPGTIGQLAWFRNDTGANSNAIGTTQIWLKTVSNPVLTGIEWEDPGTLVAEIANIDLGAGNGWLNVDIEDYVYNGGNLLVSVYTQDAPYTSPHAYWRYTTTTLNTFRSGNSDSVNPPILSLGTSRPNIQLVIDPSDPTSAPNPAVLLSPADGALVFANSTLNWTSGGGFPSSYDLYFGTSSNPSFVQNMNETTFAPTLAPNTTYYWKVVPRNAFGEATGNQVWSFSTPSATQIAEGFESTTFPPAGWANPGTWSRSTTTPVFHGSATAYKYGSSYTAYILSLPMLTINSGDYLRFASRASTLNGTLDIVYSEDRSSWTLLQTITHGVASAWQSNAVDLSSIAGNYYLGIRTGLQSASFYIDNVFGPEITPLVPGAPTLSAPADLAVNNSEYATFTWNAPSTGGVPTGYNIYLDTVDGRTQFATNVTSPYVLDTALAYNTTYYWTVEAYNAAGTGEPAPVRSFTTRQDPIIYVSSESPWLVDFGTSSSDTFPPTNWSRFAGQYPVATGTSSLWIQDDWLNVATPANKTAKINIYGTARYGWLVTPPISIPATGFELKFDLGLTRYGATTAVDPTQQADDRFMVIMSDSPNMANPIILREYNNSGSDFVYNNIPNTGTTVTLPLDGVTGTKYFAFYGESTVTGGDNDLFVDNVTLRETPADPIFTYSPSEWAFGEILINSTANKSFTLGNNGGGFIDVNSVTVSGDFFALSEAFSPISLGAGETSAITVQYNPTAAGTHSGTITISTNRETIEIDLTGSCYDPTQPLPYTQDFNGGTSMLAINWTGTMSITSNHGTSGSNGLYKNMYSYSATANAVTPPVGPMVPNAELKFDYRFVNYSGFPANATTLSANDKIDVQVSTDGGNTYTTVYTIDQSNHVTSNAFANTRVDLSAYETGSIMVKFLLTWGAGDYYVDIDNVMIRETPSAPLFGISPTSKDFGQVEVGTTATQVFTISNTGVGVLELGDIEITEGSAQYSISVPVAPESMNLATGETATFTVEYAPTAVETNDGSILINYTGGSSTVALTGEGYLRPAGSTYQNPYFVTLPLVDFADNTALYGDDYESSWVSPASNYLGGDDMVLQFTLDQPSMLSGTLTATNGTYIGMIFVNSAPSVATPAPVLALAVSGSGSTATLAATEFAAGTYSVLISTWPSPQAVTFLLNLNAEPIVVVAPGAPVLVSPANEAAGIPATGFELSWTPGADGGTPDYYAVYMSTEAENLYDDLYFEVETASFNPVVDGAVSFNYNERWYWTVEAYNTEGSALQETPFWFTIQDDPTVVVDADNPYTENFDAIAVGAMPANWTLFESHTGTNARGWKAGENIVANSLPNAAVVYYHSSYAKDEWMITPPLALEGGQLYTLSFAMKAPGWEGAPEALKVHFGTEATIAGMTANTPLWDNNNITQAEFTTLLLPFTPATTGTYYFGWHAYSNADNDFVAVDDISLFIPADTDIALSGFTGDTLAMVASPANYDVSVANLGATDINAYTITIKDHVTLMPLATASITTPLLAGNTATHELSWTPATEGDFAIIADVSADGDLVPANNSSAPILVTVYPETMNILYVGDPASTTGTTAYPFDMYYEDFVAETIYLASEIQATSGTIEALVYTNSFASAQTKQIQIWMQNTTAPDLSAGWLPWSEYTLVFDGEVSFPAGMNYIQIPIAPFSYTGGNLAIRTSRTWLGEWTPDNLWLITNDPAGRIRTRYQREDSEFVDHTSPSGTLSSISFPNVFFFLNSDSMVNTVAAPQPEISIDSAAALLEWPPVPYAYSYNVYASNDPYNFTDVVPTTVYDNSYVPADEDASFFKVTSSTYRDLDRAQPNFSGNVSVSNRINAENQRTKLRTKLTAVK